MNNKDNYTFFKARVAAYSSEPGGTLTITDDDGKTVLLPSGIVYNFEELGNMIRDDKAIVSVGVLNSFVERHGTLSDLFAVASDCGA